MKKKKYIIMTLILVVLIIVNLKLNFKLMNLTITDYIKQSELIKEPILYIAIVYDILFIIYYFKYLICFKNNFKYNILGLIICIITLLFTFNPITMPLLDIENILSFESIFLVIIFLFYIVNIIKIKFIKEK